MLTPRQRDILVAARVDGLSRPELAQRWGISLRLVGRELQTAHEHCLRAMGAGRRHARPAARRTGPARTKSEEIMQARCISRVWRAVLPSPKRLSKRTALRRPNPPMNTAHRPGSPTTTRSNARRTPGRASWRGSPTVQDGEAFKAWRGQSPAHQRAWAQASRAWRELGGVVQAYAAERPPRRARTAGRRRHSRPGGAGCWPAAPAFASLAAVGLLRPPLGLWPSYAEMQADYRTATGEQRARAGRSN